MLKKDMPKVFFRPTRKLQIMFKAKCKRLNLSQDEVLIELSSAWVVGRTRVPQEGNNEILC